MSLGAAELAGVVCTQWVWGSWHYPCGDFLLFPEATSNTEIPDNIPDMDDLLTWLNTGEFGAAELAGEGLHSVPVGRLSSLFWGCSCFFRKGESSGGPPAEPGPC